MYTLSVNEIFYSIQGEGARVGKPSIFVRLAGCNSKCAFCDTEFVSKKKITVDKILEYIEQFPSREIVWTGGEPLLQLTSKILKVFKDNGYYNCVETNGTVRPPRNIDYIALSPKVAEHVLAKNFSGIVVDEIRYVRHKGHMSVPFTKVKAKNYYISPVFDGGEVNMDNVLHCIKLVKENPKWRLTVQVHKLLKVL